MSWEAGVFDGLAIWSATVRSQLDIRYFEPGTRLHLLSTGRRRLGPGDEQAAGGRGGGVSDIRLSAAHLLQGLQALT
jgi:hypothetical protein